MNPLHGIRRLFSAVRDGSQAVAQFRLKRGEADLAFKASMADAQRRRGRNEHLVVLIGCTEAGKSTVVGDLIYKFISHRLGASKKNINEIIQLEDMVALVQAEQALPATHGIARCAFELTLEDGTRSVGLEVFDYQGSYFSGTQEIEQEGFRVLAAYVRRADHVVVLVDPETLDNPREALRLSGRLDVILQHLSRWGRRPRVSLLLTKADMYGSFSEAEASLLTAQDAVWSQVRTIKDPRIAADLLKKTALENIRRPSFRRAAEAVLEAVSPYLQVLLRRRVGPFPLFMASTMVKPWGAGGERGVGTARPFLEAVEAWAAGRRSRLAHVVTAVALALGVGGWGLVAHQTAWAGERLAAIEAQVEVSGAGAYPAVNQFAREKPAYLGNSAQWRLIAEAMGWLADSRHDGIDDLRLRLDRTARAWDAASPELRERLGPRLCQVLLGPPPTELGAGADLLHADLQRLRGRICGDEP